MEKPRKLWNRNFFLLWQGQSVSRLGSQAFYVAMIFWIKHATDSATLIGLILMVSSLPAIILGPIAGTWADRHSRRTIIFVSDLLRGSAILSMAVLMFVAPDATTTIVAWLFGVSIVTSIITTFFEPAVTAAIPDLVPDDKVASANALGQLTYQLSVTLGQGVGGTLYRLLGAASLFAINAVTYFLSALSELFISVPQVVPEKNGSWREQFAAFKLDMVEGFKYVWRQEGLIQLVLLSLVLTSFSTPVIILLPFFVENTLGAQPDWYGFLLAGWGAGSLIGALLAGIPISARKRSRLMMILVIASAAAYGALGLAKTTTSALIIAILGSMAEGFVLINITTIMQIATPREIRGRVFGLLGSVSGALAPLAMGLSGIIADLLDQNIPVIYIGCSVAMTGFALFTTMKRSYRKFLALECKPQAQPADQPESHCEPEPVRQIQIQPTGVLPLTDHNQPKE